MNGTALIRSAGLAFNRFGFSLQKKSPEILIFSGVVGVVVGTVMACKATVKAGTIKEEKQKAIDEINTASKKGMTASGEKYTEEDAKKDLKIVNIQTTFKYAKLYAPAVLVEIGSIICILGGHNVLNKKYLATAAAYLTLDRSFSEYREKIADRFGEEIEKELRYGVKKEEIETVIKDEEGNEKTVKTTVYKAPNNWNPEKNNPYVRRYDSTNPTWNKNIEMSRFFLKSIQGQANDMLKAKGHLFLNDVYELLRFPLTDYGQIVGWIYDIKNPKGDNYVDFGIFEVYKEDESEFGGDCVEAFILDFNVVGDITSDLATHQY